MERVEIYLWLLGYIVLVMFLKSRILDFSLY